MEFTRRSFTSLAGIGIAALPAIGHAQTPETDRLNRYIGHGARFTMDLPDGWEPFPQLQDVLLSGTSFFVARPSVGATFDEVAAEYSPSSPGGDITMEETSVEGNPAQILTGARSLMLPDSATILIVPYPEPFERFGSTYSHATFEVSPDVTDLIIPTISVDMSAVTPEEYITGALDIMEVNAIVTAELDYATLRADAAAVTDMDAAHAYLEGPVRDALMAAGDKHSHFTDASASVEELAASPEPDRVPTTSMLDDGTLVITLPQTSQFHATEYIATVRTAIDDAVASQECLRVILDLRENFGGDVYPMLSAIAPLLPDAPVFGFEYPHENQPQMMPLAQAIKIASVTSEVPPVEQDLSHVPVAVLFGGGTASSGELTAIAFIGRDNAQSFGMESAGYTTSNNSYYLLDGWSMNLATGIMTDRNGNAYGGTMQPDNPVDYSDDQIGTADDPVIAAAQDWLNQQPCGTATPIATPN